MGIFSFLQRQPSKRLKVRTYRAPRDKTSSGGWMPGAGRVERVPAALRTIRARARDLAHNNPHASRAVSVLTSHTVGRGIRYAIRGDDEYEAAFRAWAGSSRCDYDGALSLYGLQAVLIRSLFEAGEGLATLRDYHDVDRDELYPTLQVVDPDLLDEGAMPRGKGKVISGVEVDQDGRVAGYHIRPSADAFASEFIPAGDVIHVFERVLPGQLRGIPRGTQALVRANSVDDFLTAALARARVEACLTAFVKSERVDDGALIGVDQDDAEEGVERPELLEPGMIVPLAPGEDVSVVSPASSGGLRDYITVSLQSVAVAYGCTYSQISGDLAGVNFSSEKAGRIEFNRTVDVTREHFVMPALRRIEERFRDDFAATASRDVEVEVTMTAPGRESIEPAKDAAADMTALAAGGLTFGQYCRARGLDPEEQLAELARERAEFARRGLILKFGSAVIEDDDHRPRDW